MTVSNQTNRTSVVGDGTTQEIPFSFPASATSDIEVRSRVITTGVESDPLTENSDYTVSLSDDTGGTVTMITTFASTYQIHVKRNTPKTQLLDLEQGGSFNAENIEDALDKNTKLSIENADSLDRTLRFPETDADSIMEELPKASTRAGKFLYFGASDGNPSVAESITTGETIITPFGEELIDDDNASAALTTLGFTPYGKTLIDDANAAAARTTLEITSANLTGVINVKDPPYNAVGDGAIDDSTAVQAAVDAAIAQTYGGAVYFPPGRYLLETEISIANGGTKGLRIYGAGGHASQIRCPTSASGDFTGDAIFEVNCSNPSVVFSNFEIGSQTGGNTDVSAIKATGNGMVFENLWLQGCNYGLYLNRDSGSCANIRVSNCLSELNNTNFRVSKGRSIVFTNCHSFHSAIHGFYLTGEYTVTPPDAEGNLVIAGCSIADDTQEGILIDTNIDVIISSTEIIAYGTNKRPNYGIKIESGAKRVVVNGCNITHPEIAGIYNDTTAAILIVSGCEIDSVGYYDQTAPWACYGIFSKGYLLATNTEINACAGYGIYTEAPYNLISNVFFHDCVQGGSDGGGVDATIGNKVLYYDPQTTGSSLLLSNCVFEATAGAGAGKTAIFIGNTAVPTAGNLKFTANHIPPNHFATDFGSDLSDTQLAGQDFFGNYPIQPNYIATLDNTGTPSVKNIKIALSGGTTAITDFDDGTEGQIFMFIAEHSLDITDGTNIFLSGSTTWSMTATDTLTLICKADNKWYEVSRSDSGA